MKKKYIIFSAIIGLVLICSLIPENPLYQLNWALLATLIISLAILLFFRQFEKSAIDSKYIAIIATLSSLAAISRVVFAGIAGVQPATFIIMISGYIFGAQTGFIVGAITALVSNFFLGQGPWTPWQMIAWGICGVVAALLGKKQTGFAFIPFVIICGICGYLFGALMNVWHWIGFVYPLNLKTFLGTYAASFIFDTMHATGNVIFAVIFGKSFYSILQRYAKYL